MLTVYKLFPSVVFYVEGVTSDQENQKIIDLSLRIEKDVVSSNSFNTNMYITLGKHNLIHDKRLNFLVKKTTNEVQKYVSSFYCTHKYECTDAWLNIGNQNTYQDWHIHAKSTISCVYYATMPPGSGGITFHAPFEDMLPLLPKTKDVEGSSLYYTFIPKPKSLLIFRSFLRHKVETGTNTKPRISFAFNF